MKRTLHSAISLFLTLAMTVSMAVMAIPVTATEAEETLPDPVIMSFEHTNNTLSGVKLCDFTGDTEGAQELVTLADGTKCVKLTYLPYGSFANYRMMPAFTKKNAVTDKHGWMRITYMTETPLSCTVSILNNANSGDKVTLVQNTARGNGEFVTSNAVYFANGDMLTRFVNGGHCTVGFHCSLLNTAIYIKEIAFFASEEQAYEYYDDSYVSETLRYSAMTFGTGHDSGSILQGDNYGVNELNFDDYCVDISYANSTNMGVKYMAKLKFIDSKNISRENKFMRVYYSADIPANASSVDFTVRNDGGGEKITVAKLTSDTNGYVLSDTVEVPDIMMQRFSGTGSYSSTIHCSFMFSGTGTDGLYKIKRVYFFPTKESADNYVPTDEMGFELLINGNPIENYKIIVPEDTPPAIITHTAHLVNRIDDLMGIKLPVLPDSTPEGDYEILVGQTNRALSAQVLEDALKGGANDYQIFAIKTAGDKFVINGVIPFSMDTAMDYVCSALLYENMTYIPPTINIDETIDLVSYGTTMTNKTNWAEIENVADPETYAFDFSSDDEYFVEEQNANKFIIGGGKMTADCDDYAMTYLHVYEYNAEIAADMTYEGTDGNFGLMLRSNSDDAWVKAVYDIPNEEWKILSREGIDFYLQTLGSRQMSLTEGETYRVSFKTDGTDAILSIDGNEVLRVSGITHDTPGRPGIFAEDTKLTVDNVSLTLLSGQGTLMRGVIHTKLPDNEYREGGSVFEMDDGGLNYTHHYGDNFRSDDNGKTWYRIGAWTTYTGYVNMLELTDGTFIKTSSEGGYIYSYTSTDEGKTWKRGGAICQNPFRGDQSIKAGAGNMNDKINQAASGRIYYSQNYETTTSYFENEGDGIKRKVFCEFFYSDDNGASWTKSETDSWEIEGNEDQTHFGECKIVECADGTVRMYNSWNRYGCVVYSDSNDGGKNFGPLQMMPEFPCACSSMQFFRDPYGETDFTYYMVWVNTQDNPLEAGMPRSSLTLAKTTDGKTWTVLGDIWRWQSTYRYNTGGAFLNHIVDPFVKTNKDYVIVGTGLSEQYMTSADNPYHGAQRQHIWSVPKAYLESGEPVYPTLSVVSEVSEIYEGKTLTVDIAVSTESTVEQAVNAANFTVKYDPSKLELVSISPAAGIGGEAITHGAAYGWYNGEGSVSVTSEPTVIAKATFNVLELTENKTTSVTVSEGNGTPMILKLANEGKVYIPAVTPSGDITLMENGIEVTFVKEENYLALTDDTQLLVIESEENTRTYSLGDYNFFWSPRYKAHVAIIGANISEANVISMINFTDTPDADVLIYDGDIMKDGFISATGAAMVSEMLHNPNGEYSDRMRLEADVYGSDHIVTVSDALWILYASVGLAFTE